MFFETEKLILYRNFDGRSLLRDIPYDEGAACQFLHKLTKFASDYGFCGNIYHIYLSCCLVSDENAYSKAKEVCAGEQDSTDELARYDLQRIKTYFDRGLGFLGLHEQLLRSVEDYRQNAGKSVALAPDIRRRIEMLAVELGQAESLQDFQAALELFYRTYGVGNFGLHKAFMVRETEGTGADMVPITRMEDTVFSDIIGYELQKKKLIDNTKAFLRGRRANNVLLFGDAGTGKSSSMKALINTFYRKGLRIIEIYKHQFRLLPDILEQTKDRNYKFIIYMDDLSFEDNEIEYKYLKAILEGGLGKKPDNVLIYATSNRRHLIRESFKDKEDTDEELHRRDTVQEKISLSARFGLSIFFSSPDQSAYHEIVKELAKKAGISMPEEELLLEANRWELSHGGKSGRAASQFVAYLQSR